MQVNDSERILTGGINITVTPVPWKLYRSKCFTTRIPLDTFYNLTQFRITINTDLERATNVNLQNGTIIMFKKCSGGLYYYDTPNMEPNITKSQVNDSTFLNNA